MYHLLRSLYLHYTSKQEYSILLLGLDNAGKTTLLNQIKALYNVHHTRSLLALSDSTSTSTSTADNALPLPSSSAGDTVPTVGQNVATIDLPDMYLKIWDVGGQMSLRRLWTSYYRSCHAVVFVLDSSDLGILEADNPLSAPATPGPPGTPGLGGNGGRWHVRRTSSYTTTRSHENENGSDNNDNENGNDGDGGNDHGDSNSNNHDKYPQPITPNMLSGSSYTQTRLQEARAVLESILLNPDTAGVPLLILANKQDRDDCLEVVRIKEGFVRPVFEGEKGGMVRDSRVLAVSALKGTGVREAVEWIRRRVVWNKIARPPVMR